MLPLPLSVRTRCTTTPPAGKPANGAPQTRGRGRDGLFGKDFDVRRAAVIIDGHVNVLPVGADAAVPCRVNPVTDAENAAKGLDIEVHERTWPRPFIARDGRGRLK